MSLQNNTFGFEPLEEEKNTFGFEPLHEEITQEPSQIPRHAARIGSRVLETIVGMPGDLVGFIKNVSAMLPETPKLLDREPSFIQKAGKKLLESLPTSESLKEKSKSLTSGFTEPQSENEEFGDEIASLTTSLAIPSKDPTKFKILLSSLGKAIGVKSAGKGAELLGAEETGKAATELGSLFLTGLLGKKTAPQFVSEQFKEARSKIPTGTLLPTQNLNSGLQAVESALQKGISTPTKKEVLNSVKELKGKTSAGQMEADELVEAYHNINEKLTAKKLFDELNRSERMQLKKRYDMFKAPLSETIKDYGKYNPEFYNQWKNANQSFATIAQSKNLSNWIESQIGSLPKHLATGIALEVLTGHPQLAAATVGTAASVKTGELLYRIVKSPTLRKHYVDVMKAGTEENLPAFIKNLNSLENELSKNKDSHHPGEKETPKE